MSWFRSLSVVAVCVAVSLQAQAQTPAYLFTAVNSPNFVDMSPGDDLLPFTDDDVELAEDGNFGGVMSFDHFDNNSDGMVNDGDRLFIQAGGPDGLVAANQHLFSVSSRAEYGAIYESEDWNNSWEASHLGPTAVDAGGEPISRLEQAIAEETDFEINDNNGWTDESNAYLYNNLGNNQRGLGLPKYAVDYRHPSNPLPGADWVLDEAEGWTKTDCFVGVLDDPRTPFNERGDCRRWSREREGLVKKGYLIPVDDLDGLQDGQLPTLFGWESVDLAAYLRDTIGPFLESPDINAPSDPDVGDAFFPLSHVMLLQTEYPMVIDGSDGECGGSGDPECALEKNSGLCQVQMYASYWGIPLDGSGTLRSSQLMVANHILTELTFGEGSIHPWADLAEDGQEKNLWELDHFYRGEFDPENGDYNLGDYAADGGATAVAIASPTLAVVDMTNDGSLAIDGPGAVTTVISRPLGAGEYPIEVIVDAAENLTIDEGVGAGAVDLSYQIILRRGATVVAYADINGDATQVSVGGTYDAATGVASGGTAGAAGAGATMGAVDAVAAAGEFTRYILRVDADAVSLREAASGVYETNNFLDLDSIGEVLASAGGADGAASMLTIGTNGRAVVDTIAVFASPGTGPFNRGDCNADGGNDVSDGVAALGFTFLGDEAPGCLAACDFNGDGSLDVTNAVYYFGALFLGGNPIPGPQGAYSQRATDAALGCANPSI